MRPAPVGGLRWVKARHRSPYGWIGCSWSVEGGAFRLELEVPVSCTAVIHMPGETTPRGAGSGTHVLECTIGVA